METFCPHTPLQWGHLTHTPLQCLLVTCHTILCGNPLGSIGSRNQTFGFQGGTHRESNRLSLFVSFQEISVASAGPIIPSWGRLRPHTPLSWRGHGMGRYVTSLHRAHGATSASSLFLGHLYSCHEKENAVVRESPREKN